MSGAPVNAGTNSIGVQSEGGAEEGCGRNFASPEPKRNGGDQPFMTKGDVKKYKIPLPPLEVQKEIVAEIEEQEKIIEANKKLIGIMGQKITEALAGI